MNYPDAPSPLSERFFKIVLLAQVFISLLNTLFSLTDENAVVSMFGFYGLLERRRSVLLAYVFFTAFSGCMDMVRVLVYFDYISAVLLGFQTSLGRPALRTASNLSTRCAVWLSVERLCVRVVCPKLPKRSV